MDNKQLNDLIEMIDNRILVNNKSISTSLIGEVKSVNLAEQTIDVFVPVLELDLFEVPLFILSGGANYISFGVKPGDKCLLIANSHKLDIYLGGSSTSKNFDFNNSIAIVGLNKQTSLENKNTIKADKLEILNNSDELVSLLEKLAELTSELAGLTSQLANETSLITVTVASFGISTPPNNASAIIAIKTQIDTLKIEIDNIKSKIGGFVYESL